MSSLIVMAAAVLLLSYIVWFPPNAFSMWCRCGMTILARSHTQLSWANRLSVIAVGRLLRDTIDRITTGGDVNRSA